MKYVTGSDRHPAIIPTSAFFLFCNVLLNLLTRVPNIFAGFREPSPQLIHLSEQSRCGKCLSTCGCSTPQPLGVLGTLVYFIFKTAGTISGLFSAFSAYLATFVLSAFIALNAFNKDIEDETWRQMKAIIGAGIFFALSSLYAYFSLNRRKVAENATNIGRIINDRAFFWDRYCTYTCILGSLALISVPPSAYNSINNFFFLYWLYSYSTDSEHICNRLDQGIIVKTLLSRVHLSAAGHNRWYCDTQHGIMTCGVITCNRRVFIDEKR